MRTENSEEENDTKTSLNFMFPQFLNFEPDLNKKFLLYE